MLQFILLIYIVTTLQVQVQFIHLFKKVPKYNNNTN